jgi:hypothetical protein
MKSLGNSDFVQGLSAQLLRASARAAGGFDDGPFFTFAVLQGIKPKDELHAMGLVQVAGVHSALMRAFGDLARAQDLPHQESATRAVNQLSRTFNAQLDGLKRYRTVDDQKLAIQNVSVNPGSQAIVTNVSNATHAAAPEKLANTTLALTDARRPAMEILSEPERIPIPLRKKSKR